MSAARPTPTVAATIITSAAAAAAAAAQTTVPKVTPTVVASGKTSKKEKQSTMVQTVPSRPPTTIVHAMQEDPVPYSRKVLRPKPAGVLTASPLNPGKSVSIVGATSVTHYDRDSPPLSAARRPLLNSVDTIRDSVRISSSMEGRDTIRTSSQYSSPLYDSVVSSSLQRSDSSSSNIRIAFVDRNLASARRSAAAGSSTNRSSIDDALVTMMSDDSASSDSATMIREDSFGGGGSVRSTRSMRESFVDSYRSAAGGNNAQMDYGGKPKQLFDMFHRLCLRATNAIEHLENANTSDVASEPDVRKSGKKNNAVVEDVRDVMRLQHFIKVLTDDVRRLESIRKARAAKEKLMIRAKKIAAARRRMQQNKKLSIEEVEDEIGVTLSLSVKRRRGGGDDDIDDIEMDESFDEVGSHEGIDEDFIDDEWGDDDIHDAIDDDDEMLDEFDDGEESVGMIDDLDEEALAATTLVEAEEDLADYLLDNDVGDMLGGSPPAQLRLIRYGGAKQANDRRQDGLGASVPRAESDHPSTRSGSSSFYSSVEDDEELTLLDRRRATAAATSSMPRGEVFPVAAVEEDEALTRFGLERRGHRRSGGSASSHDSSIRSVASIRTSLQSGGTDSRHRGGSGQRSDEILLSPLKRGLSRKFTTAQLKNSKSMAAMLPRSQSIVAPPRHNKSQSPTISEEDSFVKSSASSNDADLASSHDPYSTPYTTCTTVDSSVEMAPMPKFASTAAEAAGSDKRKFIDRQKWMETEKRRRKALRTIAPLHTLSALYDPCESTPSGSHSSSNSNSAKKMKPVAAIPHRQGVISAPGTLHLDRDLIMGDGGMASEGSFAALSPMSLASPALLAGGGGDKITMLVGPDELQKFTSSTGPSTSRYSAPRHDDTDDESDASSDHSAADGHDAPSPPRGITQTPPPTLVNASGAPTTPLTLQGRMEGDIPPQETPLHSVEWSSQQHHRSGATGSHASASMQMLQGSLYRDGILMDASTALPLRPHVDVDRDQVRMEGQSPLVQHDSIEENRTAATQVMEYYVDDLVAIDAWKARQVAAIHEAFNTPGVQQNPQSSLQPDKDESAWGDEAAQHWAAVEALLESRFGKRAASRGSDSSRSYTTSDSDSSYTSTTDSMSEGCSSPISDSPKVLTDEKAV
ncbi:Hypothetical protein, putative [Bodo saltans]|uniref:GPI-anchored surface protein n=1 Tax=Bodo saltans TaxID=75058 RepID=A0A0S4JUW5_BODSA|nr:Hypothetical protein, putative [Bodo saltans]|eukprot:CUG94026.1 Hypothetical protein, putative [Bodo saltans]